MNAIVDSHGLVRNINDYLNSGNLEFCKKSITRLTALSPEAFEQVQLNNITAEYCKVGPNKCIIMHHKSSLVVYRHTDIQNVSCNECLHNQA